jgi:hypothetical protein
MEQEQLDDKMLETGKVPSDAINRLPAAANGERAYPPVSIPIPIFVSHQIRWSWGECYTLEVEV